MSDDTHVFSDAELAKKMKKLASNEQFREELETMMRQNRSANSSVSMVRTTSDIIGYYDTGANTGGSHYYYGDPPQTDHAWRRVQIPPGGIVPHNPPPFAPASPGIIPQSPSPKSTCETVGHTMRLSSGPTPNALFGSCERCGERAYIKDVPMAVIRDQLVELAKQIVGADDEQAMVSLAVELTIKANEADSLLREIRDLRELVDEVSTSRKVA